MLQCIDPQPNSYITTTHNEIIVQMVNRPHVLKLWNRKLWKFGVLEVIMMEDWEGEMGEQNFCSVESSIELNWRWFKIGQIRKTNFLIKETGDVWV